MGNGGGKAGVLLVALAVALLALAGCGGDGDDSGDAHVNEASGSTNDVPLDERAGTPPKPVKVTDLKKAAEIASCFLYRNLPEEGNKELPPNAPPPKYEFEPPTSGDHVEPPFQQADGAYLLLPEESTVVASLDHGRMTIQYAPDLKEGAQLQLKGLFDSMYGGTLFFPNEKMRYAVAATTWTNLLGCTTYDPQLTADAIRAFGKETWGKYGNESMEEFPVEGPTPAKPSESGDSE